MADNAFKNLSEWHAGMLDKAVQSNFTVNGADFLSSETVALCSGPAKLGNSSITSLIPIGLVQGAQVSQQKQIQQIFEIGARTSNFLPGRTITSASISRILFDGPSLMYALYVKDNGNLTQDMPNNQNTGDWPTNPINQGAAGISLGNSADNNANANPGQFFINLASSFFNKPLGLGFIFYDGEKNPYGGFYLEDVYIQAHNISIASQQTVLMENASLRCSALKPLSTTTFTGGA